MDRNTLTRERIYDAEAERALEGYIYGGLFAPPQVPRGIGRRTVAEFILERLRPEDSASAFGAVLETMRFYELGDIVAEVVARSPRVLEYPDDVWRACALAAMGVEFGDSDMSERADRYLDQTVVASPPAADALGVLVQTRADLAPRGTLDAVAARIASEVERREAEVEDEASLLAYDRVVALANNDLPRAASTMARKAEIIALADDAQVDALVEVYLGLADISDARTEVWSGRLLRDRVIGGDGRVLENFARRVLPVETLEGRSAAECFVHERASNAYVYLGGALTDAQIALVAGIEAPGVHFLCDEPVGYLERRLAILRG